uniref:Uncharacterized protein n=1 Tax=Oryza meridionalis TaxID=40149 RepID=A0A0E0CXD4_9ORYZ
MFNCSALAAAAAVRDGRDSSLHFMRDKLRIEARAAIQNMDMRFFGAGSLFPFKFGCPGIVGCPLINGSGCSLQQSTKTRWTLYDGKPEWRFYINGITQDGRQSGVQKGKSNAMQRYTAAIMIRKVNVQNCSCFIRRTTVYTPNEFDGSKHR